MIAPAMSPAASAAPTESTPSTTRSATNPPIGKLTRIATGQSHIRRAVLVQVPRASMIVPPLCGAFSLLPAETACTVLPFGAQSPKGIAQLGGRPLRGRDERG